MIGTSAYGACQSAVRKETDNSSDGLWLKVGQDRPFQPPAGYLVFPEAVFFAAAFLEAAFLGAAFLAAAFFTATFLTAAFFGAAFLTATFFGAAFLTAAFLTAVFFTAAFFAAGALVAAFFAAFFLATSQTSVNGTRMRFSRLPHKQSSASLTIFIPAKEPRPPFPMGLALQSRSLPQTAREVVDQDEQQLTDGTDTSSGLYLYETAPPMQHLFDNFSTKI